MAKEDDVQRILDEHADTLSRLRNVVGVGVVPAAAEKNDGEMAVAVYVTSKLPESELSPADVVPKKLESRAKGAPVQARTRVIEVGRIDPSAMTPGRVGGN